MLKSILECVRFFCAFLNAWDRGCVVWRVLRRFEAFLRVFRPFQSVLGMFSRFPRCVSAPAYGEDFWQFATVGSTCCRFVFASCWSGQALGHTCERCVGARTREIALISQD